MKQKLLLFSLVTLCLASTFTSCKKDSDDPVLSEDETKSQIAIQADDESQASFELDATIADVASVIEQNPVTSGDNSVLGVGICNATILVDVESNPMTATITYNGANCELSRTRTGKIIVSIQQGVEWKNPGASVNITYENFKVTRNMDQKSVTINGTKTYTNVSGGLAYQLPQLQSITHKTTSEGLSFKFENEAAREWKIARGYTYSIADNDVKVAISGLHSEGGVENISDWGTNRFGKTFTTSIDQPVIVSAACNKRVTGGTVTHKTAAYSATVKFGLNASGQPTTCPGQENYFLNIQWNLNNKTFSATMPY